jgi:hypothetical protein
MTLPDDLTDLFTELDAETDEHGRPPNIKDVVTRLAWLFADHIEAHEGSIAALEKRTSPQSED